MNTKDKYIADIIIVSYKNPDLTVQCVESIRRTIGNDYRLLIVDNASPDNTVRILQKQLPDVQIVVNKKNLGYSGAVNSGAALCNSEFILISNNDVIYRNGVIDGLLAMMQKDKHIAVAGPAQEYADGTWQISYGDFPGVKLALKRMFFLEQAINLFKKLSKGFAVGNSKKLDVGYVDGAVMLVRRSVFESLNGFDEDFDFYTEETDFCYRVRQAKHRVVSNQSLTVTHLRGGSNNMGNLKEENIKKLIGSKVLFCKKHLSRGQMRFCLIVESFTSFIVSKAMSFASIFMGGKLKQKFKRKARVMKDFHRARTEMMRVEKL